MNNKLKVVYLYNFQGGLKSLLPSDTLWGNWASTIPMLFEHSTLQHFLNSYSDNSSDPPQLIISSSFPFYQHNNKTFRFYPIPHLPFSSNNNTDSQSKNFSYLQNRKKIKNINYIPESVFKKILSSQIKTLNELISELENFEKETFHYPQIKTYDIIKNTIDRLHGGTLEKNGKGQLFTETEFHINSASETIQLEKTGLFFFAIDNTNGNLEKILNLLRIIGIGGNRSIGKGKFDYQIQEFDINDLYQNQNLSTSNPKSIINLSLYNPTPDELNNLVLQNSNNINLNYQLIKRQGYFGPSNAPNFIKPPIYYFKESSIFPLNSTKISTKDFSKKHINFIGKNIIFSNNIHQYGLGLTLNIY